MLTPKNSKSGFTMVEMVVVIAIIVFLFSIGLFPYSYYMDRASVENTIDSVGQEWILTHKEIRNGKMFDNAKHAHKILIFRKGSNKLEQYLLSGSTIPQVSDFVENPSNPDIRVETPLVFESRIQILDFTGSNSIAPDDSILGYLIEAPYGSGAFFTETTTSSFSSTGIFLVIGYTGASLDTGRARKILLRPYLQ